MSGEAASLTDMRNTRPADQVKHRNAVTAVDAAPTLGTLFCKNTGLWPRARVYCRFAPVKGTNPTISLRVWVRKHVAAGEAEQDLLGVLYAPCDVNGQPATKEFTITSVAGNDNFAFDVPVNADDIFVQVYSVGGSPDSYAFNCWVGWRA